MRDRIDAITISRFDESDTAEWTRFLHSSNDGTLFHDLRFLSYHPAGRFHFEHLVATRSKKLVAVIPGGLVAEGDGHRYVSPLGASIGGPATGNKLRLADATALIDSLRAFAGERSWNGIELTLGPSIYHRYPSETLSFALLRGGFAVTRQSLSLAIPISLVAGENRFERLFRSTSANEVRTARRLGVKVSEGGAELLPRFLPLFEETYRRLGSQPTHDPGELRDLLERFPDGIRIFVATLDDRELAAVLLFLLNDVAAYSFYHVMSEEGAKTNGHKVIFAHVIDWLAAKNYRWLDLGPSASLAHTNDSVVFFKEGLGGIGQTRTTWTWEARPGGR